MDDSDYARLEARLGALEDIVAALARAVARPRFELDVAISSIQHQMAETDGSASDLARGEAAVELLRRAME